MGLATEGEGGEAEDLIGSLRLKGVQGEGEVDSGAGKSWQMLHTMMH